jgi:hypothetical protein
MKNKSKSIIQNIASIYCATFPKLIQQDIIDISLQVSEIWTNTADKMQSPLEYVIIGEATQNLENYFYNSSTKTTPFLTPSHFGCANKQELLMKLSALKALVFDLYPLAIPTEYYDKKAIPHSVSLEVLMKDYFKTHLHGRINEDTVIVVRYAKLFKRIEWRYFTEFLQKEFGKVPTNPVHSIAGKANFADREKVKDGFRL